MNERIKLIREKAKQSQETFGEHIGITRSSVSLLESGKRQPSDQTIKLICSEYDINIDWLLTGNGGEENMYIPEDVRYTRNVGKLGREMNEFKKFYLNMLMDLPDDYWNYIYNEFKKFEEGKKKDS